MESPFSLSARQSRDYISKTQTAGQSTEKFAEVIARLRSSTDDGVTYSGDLLAVMETLSNATEVCKANGLRLNNADVEVSLCSFASLRLEIDSNHSADFSHLLLLLSLLPPAELRPDHQQPAEGGAP